MNSIISCDTVYVGRGGQSALRFARLRMEKRHNYVRKVAEVATQMFISNDKVTAAGLILAGSADFKTELSQSDMFDPVSKQLLHFTKRNHLDFGLWLESRISVPWLVLPFSFSLVVTGFFLLVEIASQNYQDGRHLLRWWKRLQPGNRACSRESCQCEVYPGKEADWLVVCFFGLNYLLCVNLTVVLCFCSRRSILWWNQPGYGQVLLWCRRYAESTGTWRCWNSHLLGEFGHYALHAQDSRYGSDQSSALNARTAKRQHAFHGQGCN